MSPSPFSPSHRAWRGKAKLVLAQRGWKPLPLGGDNCHVMLMLIDDIPIPRIVFKEIMPHMVTFIGIYTGLSTSKIHLVEKVGKLFIHNQWGEWSFSKILVLRALSANTQPLNSSALCWGQCRESWGQFSHGVLW